MIEIFLKTLPFFAIIGLGYLAGKTRFFSPEATAHLTKFVFYFALSAMLFRVSANLSLSEIMDWTFLTAYFSATLVVYILVTIVAIMRKLSVAEAAVEAQTSVIGNLGFLGIPMLALLMGEKAIGPVMLILAVDLIFFGSLIVILITGSRDGRMSLGVFKTVAQGLIRNPMIVSVSLGFLWSAMSFPIPVPLNEFLSVLGAAATPGALFAIGASLAPKSAERIGAASWLTFAKLILHPLAVTAAALWIFPVEPFAASVMIVAAAFPVAGNVYIIAQHYGVAPARVSATILISTTISIISLTLVLGWVS